MDTAQSHKSEIYWRGMKLLIQHQQAFLHISLKQKWTELIENGEVEFTRTGKRKRASYEMVVAWVDVSWQTCLETLNPKLTLSNLHVYIIIFQYTRSFAFIVSLTVLLGGNWL